MLEVSASGSIAKGSFLSQSQSEASQEEPELAADQSLPPLSRLQGPNTALGWAGVASPQVGDLESVHLV